MKSTHFKIFFKANEIGKHHCINPYSIFIGGYLSQVLLLHTDFQYNCFFSSLLRRLRRPAPLKVFSGVPFPSTCPNALRPLKKLVILRFLLVFKYLITCVLRLLNKRERKSREKVEKKERKKREKRERKQRKRERKKRKTKPQVCTHDNILQIWRVE